MSGFVGAVVAPSTPLLLPGVGGGRGDRVVADVLQRVLSDIAAVQALSPRRWVVVGGVSSPVVDTEADRRIARISSVTAALAPWPDRTSAGPATLPLSLAVGRHLLSAAGVDLTVDLVGVGFDASPRSCLDLGSATAVDGTALLVIGDGAARRTRRSPGDFDERAEPFDTVIEKALQEGDPGALAGMDPGVAADLMVGGRAALQVLAGAFTDRRPTPSPAGLLATDPLGLRYWVTSWT